jgi:multidrug transporter EmrE-like cation transporter
MSWILGAGRQAELGRVLEAPKALLGAMIGLAVAALALQMMALQWLWVAMLETLKRAFGVLGSVAFGRLVFFEPIDRRKQAAALLMVAGTTLLAVS